MMTRLLPLLLLLFGFGSTDAQICNGSLGDPIVNITFGAGANPGAALPAATTNYQYMSNDCPNDDYYALRNSTNSCFGSTWHSFTDHTGDPGGYFMLVNASIQPSAFYLDTVKGLCGNTTYEFAAWIVNVLKPTSCGGSGIQPDLTFRIETTDGTVVQSYNTNKIPPANSPEWKQYGFFFTTPANAGNVVLRIVNNSQGGCGNDLALDDITFRPCGPQTTVSIAGTSAAMVSHCEGMPASYSFSGSVSIGFNDPVVQWQQSIGGGGWTDVPGATSLTYTKTFPASASPGDHRFRLAAAERGSMTSAQCRVASTPLVVHVMANPPANASNDGPACEGEDISLKSNGADANWTGPSGFTGNDTQLTIHNAKPVHSGRYYVTTSNGNCSRLDSTVVVVNPLPLVSTDAGELHICEGDTATIRLNGAHAYTWSPTASISMLNDSTFHVFPKDSSVYAVAGTKAGCSDTVLVTVRVSSLPVANAGPDRSMMEGEQVQLSAAVAGDNTSFLWSPVLNLTGAQSLSPFVSPPTDTAYILQVTSLVGCGQVADTVKVHVYKKLFIPNAFSPNGDGINDRWTISGIESYPHARVSIFDRYGRLIYTTERFDTWDGKIRNKPASIGIYYYVIDRRNNFPPVAGWVAILL